MERDLTIVPIAEAGPVRMSLTIPEPTRPSLPVPCLVIIEQTRLNSAPTQPHTFLPSNQESAEHLPIYDLHYFEANRAVIQPLQ